MKGILRRAAALVGACLTLWTVTAASGAEFGGSEALRGIVLQQLSAQLPPPLSPAAMFTLSQSPYLAAAVSFSPAENNSLPLYFSPPHREEICCKSNLGMANRRAPFFWEISVMPHSAAAARMRAMEIRLLTVFGGSP